MKSDNVSYGNKMARKNDHKERNATGLSDGPSTMNFAIPVDMKEWVRAQVGAGQYSSASHYIRTLIRRDQEQLSMLDHLRAILFDNQAFAPSRPELARHGRRHDAEAWEAVLEHIIRLKRAVKNQPKTA